MINSASGLHPQPRSRSITTQDTHTKIMTQMRSLDPHLEDPGEVPLSSQIHSSFSMRSSETLTAISTTIPSSHILSPFVLNSRIRSLVTLRSAALSLTLARETRLEGCSHSALGLSSADRCSLRLPMEAWGTVPAEFIALSHKLQDKTVSGSRRAR